VRAVRYRVLVFIFLVGVTWPAYPQDPRGSTSGAAIPFELVSNFLVVVNGQIGNLEGLKFIVDTGASYSVIDRKIADKLRLKRYAGKIMNFDRSVPIEWADAPEFTVGPIRANKARVMVVKLAEYSEFAENIDGIIGLDLLSKSDRFTIDYDRKTLTFEPSAESPSEGVHPNIFVVLVFVQGWPLHLAVDTGYKGIALYENQLRKSLPNLQTEGPTTAIRMGRLQGSQVELRGVRIDGSERVTTVLLIDGPDDAALPGVDGYLGVNALLAKRIEFNFAAKVLRWQ
jgi:predicted aspartyl protease